MQREKKSNEAFDCTIPRYNSGAVEVTEDFEMEAVSRLVHTAAESVVMHAPSNTVPSPPFGLSSLLLPETFPGQDLGRSLNGSP